MGSKKILKAKFRKHRSHFHDSLCKGDSRIETEKRIFKVNPHIYFEEVSLNEREIPERSRVGSE